MGISMTFINFLTKFTWLDWFGFGLFVISWIGYEQVVEHGWFRTKRLREETNKLRLKWAYVMLKRDPRVSDAAMIANLLPSLSFYANTTIYIIAALFAALGAIEQLMNTASDLPFARVLSREAMEIKLLILIGVFVIAYFKFTWSLRQFNLLTIALGAVPLVGTDYEMEKHARKFAAVNSCAGNDFNRGLRAYYFGMAVMAWMVSAWLFILSTLIIVFVMARREFASPVFKALSEFADD
jgi:uncharacterized membrane protein